MSNLIELKKYLKDYLQSIGINTSRKVLCISKDHNDTNPSMQYNSNNNTMHCWSCGCNMDIFDIVQLKQDCNFVTAKKIVEKMIEDGFIKKTIHTFKSTTKSNKVNNLDDYKYSKDCLKNIDKTSYFRSRNIKKSTCEKLGVGYDPIKNHIIVATQYPNLSYIYKNLNNGGKGFYFTNGVGTNLSINGTVNECNTYFIIEGAFDALSFVQEGQNVICMNSVNNTKNLFDFLKHINFLDDFKVVLALDNDEIGKVRTEQITRKLSELNINYKEFVIPQQYKDINEYYCSDIVSFKKNMEDYKMEKDMNSIKEETLRALTNVKEAIENTNDINEISKLASDFAKEISSKIIKPISEYTGIVKSFNDFQNNNGSTNRRIWIELEDGKKLSLQKYCKDIKDESVIEVGDSITVKGKFNEFINNEGKKQFSLSIYELENHTEKERNDEFER